MATWFHHLRLMCYWLKREEEYPLAAENGVQATARPQQPEIRQTETEATIAVHQREAALAPEAVPPQPVLQGTMIPANQQFRGMQCVEKLRRPTDFAIGNMSDLLPGEYVGPHITLIPLSLTSA